MLLNTSQIYMLGLAFSIVVMAQQAPTIKMPASFQIKPASGNYEVNDRFKEWPLPQSLQDRNIHYEHVPHIKGLSCGYNCLLNATRLEQSAGITHEFTDLDRFRELCVPYLKTKNLKITDGISITILEHMSAQLSLQPTTLIGYNNDQVTVLSTQTVNVLNNTAVRELDRQKLFHKASDEHMKQLKEYFKSNDRAILHFICEVTSAVAQQEHVILVTLIKNKSGSIDCYVRDNMNESIANDGKMHKYLQYLMGYFTK